MCSRGGDSLSPPKQFQTSFSFPNRTIKAYSYFEGLRRGHLPWNASFFSVLSDRAAQGDPRKGL